VSPGEKREMPPSSGYGGGGYEQAPAQYAQQPPQHSYGGQTYAAPQQYSAAPPYSNPGFSVQTGFEGFLVHEYNQLSLSCIAKERERELERSNSK
jgi:hypothetical protein